MNKYVSTSENDLFSLLELFWREKPIIIKFMLFSLLISGIYSNFVPKKYIISFSTINNIDVNFLDKKNINYSPSDRLSFILKNNWLYSKKTSTFTSTTHILPDIEKYAKELDVFNDKITLDIYNNAINNLKIIDGFKNNKINNTEKLAAYFLQSTITVNAIDNGKKALALTPISYKLNSLNNFETFISGIFLSLFLSMIFVIVRAEFNLRK
jgi:LPS O-antigen subunit length determinant protein (WzzB/FepE family)